MLPNRAIPGSRWLLAIGCSIIIHSMFAGGWFVTSPAVSGYSGQDLALADSPGDDRETTIILKDPPARKFRVDLPKSPPKPETPAKLPTELTKPVTPNGSGPAKSVPEEKQAGYSPDSGNSSPSTSPSPLGTPRLHGKVKAGKTVVYLIDTSSSMGLDLLRAKAVALSSIRQLGPKVSFQLVAYNSSTKACFAQVMPADEKQIDLAEKWLAGLSAEGRSDHIRGFREAISFRPDALFLMTDADDFDEKEVKKILSFTPPELFVNAAIFGTGDGVTTVTPLDYLTRRQNGSIRQFPR